jgi:hypothetical protein
MRWRQGPTYHGQGSLHDYQSQTIQKHSISCADIEGAFGAYHTESVCSMEVSLKTNPV